jgi:3-dehydroquinate synthase
MSKKLTMNLGADSYDILLEAGCLDRCGELLSLNRKVLVVTDSGVPATYAETVASAALSAEIVRIPRGEASKDFDHFRLLMRRMLAFGMDRGSCVAAVGGGVVGDLSGFAAACYMRGIDFYNIPTTVLSQVDSSIGGKTAIDLDGVKNIVGAFCQPRRVLIDPRTLSTLPPRQVANGLAEAVKMALCFDADGFARFEAMDLEKEYAALAAGRPVPVLEAVIEGALKTKRYVVQQDVKEHGLRRVLNFGHTLGHGIESLQGENGLLHGECVALGMLPLCSAPVRERLLPVLEKLGLPTSCGADPDRVMRAVLHDKKSFAGKIRAVFVDRIGSFTERELSPEELKYYYKNYFFSGHP